MLIDTERKNVKIVCKDYFSIRSLTTKMLESPVPWELDGVLRVQLAKHVRKKTRKNTKVSISI